MRQVLGPIAALILFAAGAEADAPHAADLISLEARALSSTSPERLERLMTGRDRPAGREGPRIDADWLARQPRADGDAEWRCLAEALYFEARGETVEGQFAVAEVILNRVNSARFPDSICGVVNQGTGRIHGCQFSYACDGVPESIAEPRAWATVGKVARAVIDRGTADLTDGATHYHTTAVAPRWALVYDRTARIGSHLFYRHTWRATRR